MSTILDALRKAQDETATDKRQVRVEEIPAPDDAPEPPRGGSRRALSWLVGIAAVLGLAFVGGLALGNRVSDMFLAGRDRTPAAVPEDAKPAVAKPEVAKQEPSEPAGGPREVARGEAPAQVAQADTSADRSERAAAARREARAQRRPAPAALQQPPAEEPVPTPYGRLHVFGAPDGAGHEGASAEDRAARLRQLREKMLKARREASERGQRSEESAAAIVAPPPGGAAPAAPAPVAAAPAPQEAPAEAPRVAAADPAVAEPPPEPVVRRPTSVGVSVGGDAPSATAGEIRDPDIVMQDDPPAPPAEVAAEPAAEPAPAPAEPVAVAAVPRADVAPPPAAPAPPVLRRSPGGAPQVSINILQWSAEPGRRFAFVSIDGGGMTQVREGDRIGSLTVKHIHQQMIEFGFNDSTFLLRAN